jgi:hypothetical protein
MTVSNAMTEAGIATYERINRARMSPQAIVAAIYNAMDTVRRREAIKAPGPAAAYVHQAWPAFRYGPNGQSAKFTQESDVPPGWADSPKKVGAQTSAQTFVEAAQTFGAETMADIAEKRRPGRPRKEAA